MNNKTSNWHTVLGLWLVLSIVLSLSLSAVPLKIMMLGDSITEGGGAIPDIPESNQSTYTQGLIQNPNHIAYRGKLFDLLKADGYSIGGANDDLDFVGSRSGGVNYPTAFDMDYQAVSGYTSKQILDNIDGWLATTPADIFLLHVGTNDGAQRVPIGSYDDVNETNNTTVNNVKKILVSIFTANPNAKVFVARIIEGRRAEAYSPWRTNTLNDKIEEMVNNHSKSENIKMVNMQDGAGIEYDTCGTANGDMQPYEIHTSGNIYYDFHPNYNGYEKMAATWHTALVASGWLPSLGTDDTRPSITLKGSAITYLVIGDTYEDKGATATDNIDGDISNKIIIFNNLNVNEVGTYTIQYNVTDNAGNKATQVTRTIHVREKIYIWYKYNKLVNTATILPINSDKHSLLSIEDNLESSFDVSNNSIILKHAFSTDSTAYILGKDSGELHTGFKKKLLDDRTLKTGTAYNLGTNSVMKKVNDKIIIVTTTKLKKGELLVIGGK